MPCTQFSLMVTFCTAKIQHQNQNSDIGTTRTYALVCACVVVLFCHTFTWVTTTADWIQGCPITTRLPHIIPYLPCITPIFTIPNPGQP